MTEKIEISRVDVKASQILLWLLTFFSMVPPTLLMFFNFSWNVFLVFAIGCVVNVVVQYGNAKVWNVWYENGNIVLENIYTTKVKSVNDFERIEMTSVFRNSYTIYFSHSEKYHFRIKLSQDLRLQFKSNDQYYANQMNAKLQEIKDSIND